MADVRTLHVVSRVGWMVNPCEPGYTQICPDFHERPTADDRRFVPVAAFGTREAAEARVRELELEAARLFNPFWRVGSRFALTEQPDALLPRLAVIVGALPGEAATNDSVNRRVWCEWWDEHVSEWSDETLWEIWGLFDQIRFYAVLEVEVGDE